MHSLCWSLYANQIFMYFCIKSSIGPRVKLASCKSALTPPPPPPPPAPRPPPPPVVYSTDRSKVVSLTLCCFVVHSTRRFVLSLALCYFILVFFSPFIIVITSLREEKAHFNACRTFVRLRLLGFVCFLFLLVSGKGCG